MDSQGKLKFNLAEFSGSLGDLGLFIPLVVAMAINCQLDLGIILIFAGLMNVVTGFMFNQPIPVQPMKAIAAIAITESLTKGDLAAGGILMGLIILLASLFIDKINTVIPKAIVRGIQLGLGLKLVSKAATDILKASFFGWDSIFIAIIVIVVIILFAERRIPILLYVFIFGFFCLWFKNGAASFSFSLSYPNFTFIWPEISQWQKGLLKLSLPQVPLTLLNSVIAVCALSAEYYPKKAISPSRMARSVALMNILCVPFGGIPMCHGAGGLAAQYKFGARTGGSVIMLGLAKIIIGLLFGGLFINVLQMYPKVILSALLIFAGLELAKSSKDSFGNMKDIFLVLLTTGFILGVDTGIGFLVGCAGSIVIYCKERLLLDTGE